MRPSASTKRSRKEKVGESSGGGGGGDTDEEKAADVEKAGDVALEEMPKEGDGE